MASLWRKSQEVIRDNNDQRAVGARAYFYLAATTTPLATYTDNALTTPHPDPVVADAYGRMPAVFFDVSTPYKERVETSGGTLLWETDNIDPAPATSGGGGGGSSVDATDLLDCGDVIWRPATGTRVGWARLNGRTIGNAASSATERANDDCEALFALLWNADAASPNNLLAVSTGKGASAAADWAANKTLALPDARARPLLGLDDMGNTAAGRLAATTFAAGTATKLFSSGGTDSVTLQTTEIPAHTHGASMDVQGDHNHGYNVVTNVTNVQAGGTAVYATGLGGTLTTNAGNHQHNITVNNAGGGGAHQNMPPFLLGTFYIKLNRETV